MLWCLMEYSSTIYIYIYSRYLSNQEEQQTKTIVSDVDVVLCSSAVSRPDDTPCHDVADPHTDDEDDDEADMAAIPLYTAAVSSI